MQTLKTFYIPIVFSFPILSGRSLKQVEKPPIILIHFEELKARIEVLEQ